MNELEEERDHLLRSLDDLEREHEAGDVDDTDYATFRDDYTARAAAVIRSIDAAQTERTLVASSRSWGRTFGWVAAVLVFAVLAGVLVAQLSGSRRDGETATGDVRENTRQLLADASTSLQPGKYGDAIELYTEALALSPSNAEALAYRGWARYLNSQIDGGDVEAATDDIDAAIAADASYPDPRVFKAIVLADGADFRGAAEQLAVFDTLDPPSIMVQIIATYALRERITAGVLLADGAPGFAEAGFDREQVYAAANFVAESERKPADAITLFDQLLAADPNDAEVLAAKGFVLARVGVQAGNDEVVSSGLAAIDAALAVDPQYPAALVYRAFTLFYGEDDAAGAQQALDAFDALREQPADLVTLLEQYSLRSDVTAALQK